MAFQFKTIKGPRMSNVPPASDHVIAHRTAKLTADYLVLCEEEKRLAKPHHHIMCECECPDVRKHREGCGCRCDFTPKKSWQIEEVKAKLQAQLKKLLKEHDEQRAAYDEWLSQGKPDL